MGSHSIVCVLEYIILFAILMWGGVVGYLFKISYHLHMRPGYNVTEERERKNKFVSGSQLCLTRKIISLFQECFLLFVLITINHK